MLANKEVRNCIVKFFIFQAGETELSKKEGMASKSEQAQGSTQQFGTLSQDAQDLAVFP